MIDHAVQTDTFVLETPGSNEGSGGQPSVVVIGQDNQINVVSTNQHHNGMAGDVNVGSRQALL